MSSLSSWCGGEGAAGVVVRNLTGGLIASAGAGVAFGMPWGSLNGTYSLKYLPVDHTSLCAPGAGAGWAGKVIMGHDLFEDELGCSYETRARVALAQAASGLIYRGIEHTRFDWDARSVHLYGRQF